MIHLFHLIHHLSIYLLFCEIVRCPLSGNYTYMEGECECLTSIRDALLTQFNYFPNFFIADIYRLKLTLMNKQGISPLLYYIFQFQDIWLPLIFPPCLALSYPTPLLYLMFNNTRGLY